MTPTKTKFKRIRPTPPPPSKLNTFNMPGEPRAIEKYEFSEVLRLLSGYTYTPLQAEHANVILKGQTRA